MKNARDTTGKFAVKSEAPRKVRSVNLTDAAWEWLAHTAEQAGMSRNDFLEAMAASNEPLTNFSPKVEPRDTGVYTQIKELQAEVKVLHRDIQKTQKALDLVSSKLADLAPMAKAAK